MTFVIGGGGGVVESRVTKVSRKEDIITVDIYVQQYKEKQLTTSFSYMGHNVSICLVIYMNVYVRYESNLIITF